MAATNRITGLTKYERPFEDFNICETDDGEFIVYLDHEEIGTFDTRYRAALHVACVSALAHGTVITDWYPGASRLAAQDDPRGEADR